MNDARDRGVKCNGWGAFPERRGGQLGLSSASLSDVPEYRKAPGFALKVLIHGKGIRSPGLATCPDGPDRHGSRRGGGRLFVLAQRVFIPVSLAVFLTFLLAPLVSFLQWRHVGRGPSVVLVVLLAVLVLGGVVWLVTIEVTSLAGELPTYTKNIRQKIRSLREMGQGSAMEHLDKMIQDIAAEWQLEPVSPEGGTADQPAEPVVADSQKPSAVVVQPESPAWLSRLPPLFSPVVESLGSLALALVLVVFMLLKREGLRNRLIGLVGRGRLTVTTKALEDAGQRISRFLLMQLIINASYGLALTSGLFLIQMPHALLWGFLAAILRYVPYLGTSITSVVLVALSLAVSPGVGATILGSWVDRSPRSAHL